MTTESFETTPRGDLPRATIGILFIVTLITLSMWVLRPFLGAIIWASMIVIATWPLMRWVQRWLRGSRALATTVMTIGLLLLVVLPLSLVIGAIAANAGRLIDWVATAGSIAIPPPPQWLTKLPVVGEKAADVWRNIAAGRLTEFASTAAPYATTAILWVADTMRGVAGLLLQFLLTVAISAVMYVKGERAADGLLLFGRRLAGEPGDNVVRLAAQAIRAVALGVVVTASIQAGLAGIGLAVAGVPFAALLASLIFVLCIAQLGPALVLVPSVAWMYWQGAPVTATILLVWSLVVMVLDNVLRPILMSKGGSLPMLLMFAGVMGGLLAFGLIGIFVGPVVLAVTYTLLGAWVRGPAVAQARAADSVQ
jgi:predicted PurR-regulated permease PerM